MENENPAKKPKKLPLQCLALKGCFELFSFFRRCVREKESIRLPSKICFLSLDGTQHVGHVSTVQCPETDTLIQRRYQKYSRKC